VCNIFKRKQYHITEHQVLYRNVQRHICFASKAAWTAAVGLEVQSWVTSRKIRGGPNGTGADFSVHLFGVLLHS
jgi:hypothetical protein